jgi:putative transposase
MTEQSQISLADEVLNTILTGGLDGLPEAVSLLINHAMLIERHRHLGAAWMENNLPEGLTVFAFPEPIRKHLRTSNLCEAPNKQIRRRTRVAAIFPDPESCLRLVLAILMEISEAWETSKAYLNPQLLK